MKPLTLKPQTLKVIGMDPSLRNWGLVIAHFEPQSAVLCIDRMAVVHTTARQNKQVRQNSADVGAAQHLFQTVRQYCRGAHAVFVEVPHGSQSSRAMASYGICVGVLGALRDTGVPLYELAQQELKQHVTGTNQASKDQMMAFAHNRYPQAPWPEAANLREHMADALIALEVGVQSDPFRQMLSLLTPSSVETIGASPVTPSTHPSLIP